MYGSESQRQWDLHQKQYVAQITIHILLFWKKIICFEYKPFLWNRLWYDHLDALITWFGRNGLYAPNIFNKLEGQIALGPLVIPFVRPLQKLSYSFEIS